MVVAYSAAQVLEGHRNGKDWSPVFHFKSLTEEQNALLDRQ